MKDPSCSSVIGLQPGVPPIMGHGLHGLVFTFSSSTVLKDILLLKLGFSFFVYLSYSSSLSRIFLIHLKEKEALGYH